MAPIRPVRTSVSGLTGTSRAECRRIITKGVALMMHDIGSVHYTMGSQRWEGIDRALKINEGERPSHSDCSSSSTWLLWNALHVRFGLGDLVNGQNWKAGYTGTMLHHGKVVQHEDNLKIGDLALYGVPGTTGKHVAVIIGHKDGRVKVFSHGSEAGPFILDMHYRPDLIVCRRYI